MRKAGVETWVNLTGGLTDMTGRAGRRVGAATSGWLLIEVYRYWELASMLSTEEVGFRGERSVLGSRASIELDRIYGKYSCIISTLRLAISHLQSGHAVKVTGAEKNQSWTVSQM